MANYMKQVAEILDVDFGEEFNLCYQGELVKCKLTPYDIEYYEEDDEEWVASYGLLGEIFTDLCEIKKQWKPKKDEVYFTPNIEDGVPCSNKCCWYNTQRNDQHYKSGMLCKTKEEALDKAQYMLNTLKEYIND